MKWTYDEDLVREWLDGWLNREASPVDILTRAWFYGEAKPGSGWTRDKELSEWIAATKTHWHAWEGVRRLLKTLRENNRPIPVALLVWALDVATGTRRPPTQKRGRNGRRNVFRNRSIVTAIAALRGLGIPATSNTPGRSACHMVADRMNLSYEAIRTVWQSSNDMTVADCLNLDRGFD